MRPTRRLHLAALARRAATALACVAATSCGEPTGPSDGALRSGRTVSGSVAGAQVARFRYVAGPMEAFEIQYRLYGDSTRAYAVRAGGDTLYLPRWQLVSPDTLGWAQFVAGPAGMTLEVLFTARGGSGRYTLTVRGQDRRPESRGVAAALGDTIEEDLEHRVDADVYTLTIPRDTDVVLSARVVGGDRPRAATAYLRTVSDTSRFAPSIFVLTGRELDGGSWSARAERLPAGRYELRVESASSLPTQEGRIRYQVLARAYSRAPEERGREVVLGDTVLSAIDHHGDEDQWVVRGAAGDQVVLFVQASGMPAVNALVTEPHTFVNPGRIVRSGATLLAGAVERFTLPASGRLEFRVIGDDGAAFHAGGYRFVAHKVDTLPEERGATVAPGEDVNGALDPAGDVDSYRLVLPAPGVVNVVLQRPAPNAGAALHLHLRRMGVVGTTLVMGAATGGGDAQRTGSGRLALPAGTYDIRVESPSAAPGSYVGPYRFQAVVIDSMPESRASAIAIGDTVRGERIGQNGDLDVFAFEGSVGDTVLLHFRPEVASASLPLVAELHAPCECGVARRLDLASGAAQSAIRFPLSIAGRWTIRVSGRSGGVEPADSGTYRVGVERFSGRPERALAAFAVGDTVDERLDFPSDVDGYVMTGPPGSDVIVALRATGQPAGKQFVINAYVDATGEWFDRVATTGPLVHVGRFRLPPSGRLRLGVSELDENCSMSGCSTVYSLTGDYRLTSYVVDRRPEGRAVEIAIGDTIAEHVDPVGDIDEYTFTAVAGDRLLLQFATPDGTTGLERMMRAYVTDYPQGPDYAWIDNASPSYVNTLEGSQKAFVAPRTGTYRIFVDGIDDSGSTGRYLLRIARQP